MTKIFTILSLVIIVAWGCTKKANPTSSTAPASNSGSAMQAPQTNTDKPAATTTPAANTNIQGSQGVPGPTGTLAAAPPKPEEAPLIAGQQTFNAKCGRCHGYKPTTDYTADRWVSIMQVMAPKANLNETEKANVLAYVKANAKK
jgi:mono/diheme cytochrome c family protein